MILGINIISRKANVAVLSAPQGLPQSPRDALSSSAGILRGRSPQRNFLGFKDHLDWLKTDLTAAKIITVHSNKCTKN